jgi:hypothetical protein
MMAAMPRYRSYAGGLPGGLGNPLGARALYLYRDGHDTYFRLHGTNEPESIGHAVSSGCIRLLNQDIEDLYSRVQVGTRVVVLPSSQPQTAAIGGVPGVNGSGPSAGVMRLPNHGTAVSTRPLQPVR